MTAPYHGLNGDHTTAQQKLASRDKSGVHKSIAPADNTSAPKGHYSPDNDPISMRQIAKNYKREATTALNSHSLHDNVVAVDAGKKIQKADSLNKAAASKDSTNKATLKSAGIGDDNTVTISEPDAVLSDASLSIKRKK